MINIIYITMFIINITILYQTIKVLRKSLSTVQFCLDQMEATAQITHQIMALKDEVHSLKFKIDPGAAE